MISRAARRGLLFSTTLFAHSSEGIVILISGGFLFLITSIWIDTKLVAIFSGQKIDWGISLVANLVAIPLAYFVMLRTENLYAALTLLG